MQTDQADTSQQDAEWDEPEEIPARPRRKLLTPLPVTMLAVLIAALGFWAGVKVQKSQGSSAGASSLASAFAGLRAGASAGKGKGTAGSSSAVPSGFPGAGGVAGVAGSSNVTTGEVTYVNGDTIYVSNSDGNTVKVLAGEGTRITETVTTHVHSIHPGDTVVVQGSRTPAGRLRRRRCRSAAPPRAARARAAPRPGRRRPARCSAQAENQIHKGESEVTSTDRQPTAALGRGGPLAALALVALLCVWMAACGGSGTSSTSSNAAKVTSPAGGAGSARFSALSACLKKQGITLPTPSASKPPSTTGTGAQGGPPTGGGLSTPSGVSASKYREALKKCGGSSLPAGGSSFSSATAKAALSKYVTCMRENGVDLPKANTSGSGPVFDSKGLDTSSATFKAAQSKCQTDLKGAFGGAGGTGGPPSGGPPSGGSPGEGGAPPSGGAEPEA